MNGKSVWTTTGASVCCFAVRERAVGHQKKEGEEKGKGSISLETHKQIETSTTQELLFFFFFFFFWIPRAFIARLFYFISFFFPTRTISSSPIILPVRQTAKAKVKCPVVKSRFLFYCTLDTIGSISIGAQTRAAVITTLDRHNTKGDASNGVTKAQ
jgi:hypothetical protein